MQKNFHRTQLVVPGISPALMRWLIRVSLVIVLTLGCSLGAIAEEQSINHQPIWTAFDKLFCRGVNMFSCSLENPINCDQSNSNVTLTIDFKARKIDFHGAYRGAREIMAVTFKDTLNPMQTILLDSNRVIQIAHYKFKNHLEIRGYLIDSENVAFAEPKETIERGVSGHTLTCFQD